MTKATTRRLVRAAPPSSSRRASRPIHRADVLRIIAFTADIVFTAFTDDDAPRASASPVFAASASARSTTTTPRLGPRASGAVTYVAVNVTACTAVTAHVTAHAIALARAIATARARIRRRRRRAPDG